MNCPVCATQLQPSEHELITVDACPDGHGSWLDGERLIAIVKRRDEDRSTAEEDAALAQTSPANLESIAEDQRTCPSCGSQMRKLVYAYQSGVVIDVCDVHGIWLDQGELERIEAWVEGNERFTSSDRITWAPKLQQMERESEREAARAIGAAHWGPVGWISERLAWWWYRHDD